MTTAGLQLPELPWGLVVLYSAGEEAAAAAEGAAADAVGEAGEAGANVLAFGDVGAALAIEAAPSEHPGLL
eukprot:tig00021108_g18308.t1